MVKASALFSLLAVPAVAAFTGPVQTAKPSTALNMNKDINVAKFFAGSVASAILLSSAAFTPDALASSPDFDFGSNTVISARSGGRGGGRSSASSMRSPRPAYQAAPTTTINRTTVIAAPTPVISSPIVVSPFGYSPFGSPFGGYGALGAVNAIGNEMREGRQENEIARERSELEASKQRQQQLEQRLYELERNQAAQPR